MTYVLVMSLDFDQHVNSVSCFLEGLEGLGRRQQDEVLLADFAFHDGDALAAGPSP